MTSPLRTILKRRLNPLRWRDEKLAEQREALRRSHQEVAQLRSRLHAAEEELTTQRNAEAAREKSSGRARSAEQNPDTRPSFRREMLSLRTQVRHARTEDTDFRTPLRQIPNKLRNYRLAQSHGIRVPEILGLWPDASSIDLAGLPDQFVLKSDGGAGGQGVFPLQRATDNTFAIAGSTRSFTEAELIESITSMRPGKARPPFFAEEFLTSKEQDGPIPQDVKIYAFYGEIGQILLRSVAEHGSHDATRYRFLWSDGSDLGEVSFDSKAPPIDPTVPIPADLDGMLEVARHLSMCLGTSFIRVDVYDTPGGPTFGELTRAPGGEHRYRTSHDQQMGAMWLRARMRLEHDLMLGRPPGTLFGEEPAVDYYQRLGLVQSGPGAWPVTTRSCTQWCQGTLPTTPQGA